MLDFDKNYEVRRVAKLTAMVLSGFLLALFLTNLWRFTGETIADNLHLSVRCIVVIVCVNLLSQILERGICWFSYFFYFEDTLMFSALKYSLDLITVFGGTGILNYLLRGTLEAGIAIRVSYMTFLVSLAIFYGIILFSDMTVSLKMWFTDREEKKLDKIMEEARKEQKRVE